MRSSKRGTFFFGPRSNKSMGKSRNAFRGNFSYWSSRSYRVPSSWWVRATIETSKELKSPYQNSIFPTGGRIWGGWTIEVDGGIVNQLALFKSKHQLWTLKFTKEWKIICCIESLAMVKVQDVPRKRKYQWRKSEKNSDKISREKVKNKKNS